MFLRFQQILIEPAYRRKEFMLRTGKRIYRRTGSRHRTGSRLLYLRAFALIAAWGNGDEEALRNLIPLRYPQLRRIARLRLGRRPGHTLESAALANEAYIKLIRAGGIRCENRVHFLALCSQIIRRILVDHARNRAYAKRSGDAVRVPLDEALLGIRSNGIDVLALNEALASLSKVDARRAA